MQSERMKKAWLLDNSIEYRSGRRRRIAGIVLSTAGPVAGGLLALGGYLVLNGSSDGADCGEGGCGMESGLGNASDAAGRGLLGFTMLLAGGVIAAGTLITGIILAVTGQRKMSRARERLFHPPRISFSAGPGGVAIRTNWRF
jgi:hypothetical protein